MDQELKDIQRRAGILDEQGETYSMASHEDLTTVIDYQMEALDKIGAFLGRNARINNGPPWVLQAIQALAQNKTQLEKYKRQKVTGAPRT